MEEFLVRYKVFHWLIGLQKTILGLCQELVHLWNYHSLLLDFLRSSAGITTSDQNAGAVAVPSILDLHSEMHDACLE